jgi:hypothetical protein
MTNRHSPSPEDRFNAYLDALASGRSTPDASDAVADQSADPSMPAETARELHDLARAADARQGDPPDSIWENIMHAGVATPAMSPRAITTRVGPEQPPEASRGATATIWPGRRSRPQRGIGQRAGRWFNILAAAVLLLGLAAGWYFSSIGPGGSGGGRDDGQFAALPAMQGGTPAATPAPMELLGPEDCTVEPLTVDEVMAIVENPSDRVGQLGLYGGKFVPGGGMYEEPSMGSFTGPIVWPREPNDVTVPDGELRLQIEAVTNEYLACLAWGANFQLWALEYPGQVQSSILGNFPVYRSQEQVRAYVESEGPRKRTTVPEGYVAQMSPDRSDTVVATPTRRVPDQASAFVGISTYRLEDAATMANVDWTGKVTGSDPTLSTGYALLLAYFPDADTWLVEGVYSERG